MKFNFKEYEVQDITCKGSMRRRYNNLIERYKGYVKENILGILLRMKMKIYLLKQIILLKYANI